MMLTRLFGSAAKSFTIEYYLPAIAILENISALLMHKKFEPHVKWVLKSLDNYGYVNKLGIIDSLDYVPQSRPRLYLVSIHKDRATRRNSCVPLLPSPPPRHLRAPLQTLLEPHATPCSPEFCPLPPKSKELAYENVLSAYAKANVNPFKVPLIIDSGCSASAPASEFVEWLRVLLSCPMMTLCDRADFESKFAEADTLRFAKEIITFLEVCIYMPGATEEYLPCWLWLVGRRCQIMQSMSLLLRA